MSAFIVDDSTIDRIVTYLGRHDQSYLARMFHPLGYDPAAKPEAFAQALFDMNCQAVNQRYADRPARTEFHPEPYAFRVNYTGQTAGAILKAVSCLRYQCSEGDVPETPLFKALDHLGHGLAYEVASKTEEYEKAEWG